MNHCCNADCWFEDVYEPDPNRPCWGDVEVVDEITFGDDWAWIHSCQGHHDMYDDRTAPYSHE